MNKDELLKQKEVLQAELNKLEELIKQEEEPAYYTPKQHERYYYIDAEGDVCGDTWVNLDEDTHRHEFGNCYKTSREARYASDIQKDLVKLQRLALTLNKGERIDWERLTQNKYYILYNQYRCEIEQWETTFCQDNRIYCLSNSFKAEAIKLFGEERLKEILTYQRY